MPRASLRDLYGGELRDLRNAERRLAVVLSQMARNATAPLLRQALANHGRHAGFHARRLAWMCEGLHVSMEPKRCAGMDGLIGEVRDLLMGDYSGDVLDAGLTASAFRITQYKIVSYATARARALQLGFPGQAALLDNVRIEETQAHETLGMVARALSDSEVIAVATAPAERRRDTEEDVTRRDKPIPDPDGSGGNRPDADPPPPKRGGPNDPRDLEPEDRPSIRRDGLAAVLPSAPSARPGPAEGARERYSTPRRFRNQPRLR